MEYKTERKRLKKERKGKKRKENKRKDNAEARLDKPGFNFYSFRPTIATNINTDILNSVGW